MGESLASLLPQLESLLDAGVLRWDGDMLAFVDDDVRAARYRDLPSPLRMALHRQVGNCLRARNSSKERIVNHLSLGSRPRHERDLAALDGAVCQVVDESPVSGADAAQRAFELSAPEDARLAGRSIMATRALLGAGRVEDARSLAGHAIDLLDDGVAVASLRLVLSTVHLMASQWVEATMYAATVLHQPGLPEALYGEAKLAQLRSFMSEGNQIGMRSMVASIMSGDEGFSDDAALGAALVVNAQWTWDGGRPADATVLLRAAVDRADKVPSQVVSAHPRLLLAAMLTSIGELTEARQLIELSSEHIGQTFDTLWAPAIPIQMARLALADGKLDAAAELATVGLEQASDQRTTYFSSMARSVLAVVALNRGDLSAAAAAVRQSSGVTPPAIGFYGESAIAQARARVTEAQGNPEEALETLSAACREPTRLHRMLLEDPTVASWWIRVALSTGNRSLAGEVTVTMEHLARSNDELPGLASSAMHARGLFEEDLHALQAAASGHVHAWARASAAEDAGRLATSSDHAMARSFFTDARAGYQEAGATRDVSRVVRALRRCSSHGKRGPGSRPVSGWASLTDAERRVALTVAEGRTNVEAAAMLHLSRHTVDFHLRHIFRKLNLESRVELAWSVATSQRRLL
ncbi:MAG TPA: LuxR C-terminal-related transcriptional regulator [Acidimicrobiales bacterium]|nr:LuxR C-terminal-related transcriptional regulator [Acidimicrobiales bacterium]